MKLTPAEYVIFSFGGVRQAAKELGCHFSTVSRWQSSGQVPANIQKKVLDRAKKNKLSITPSDLVLGRVVPNGELKDWQEQGWRNLLFRKWKEKNQGAKVGCKRRVNEILAKRADKNKKAAVSGAKKQEPRKRYRKRNKEVG